MSSNLWPSINDLMEGLNKGAYTAQELVARSLEQIKKHQEFQAIICTLEDRAKKRAIEIDDLRQRGASVGRLAGVPFIAKDNFLTFGAETTAASNILRGFEAPYQATAIQLLEDEGAICVAKANLDAFAHGSSTENSDFMVTKNPHDTNRVPGGSSGGSAAAVVLGLAPFALGTDTGGSIRLPAAFCGGVGYKPTYGLVSRSGVIAMASSTDVIGPITNSVEDAAYILDIIAHKDPLDATTIDRESQGYMLTNMSTKIQKKVGVIQEHMATGVDPETKRLIDTKLDQLQSAGWEVVPVSLPSLSLALACYYVLCPAEVSSNLSRYDGQRFGFSVQDALNLDESYNLARSEGFGYEAKRRIMLGTYVLSSGYYDAYYKRAQQIRTKIIQDFTAVFNNVPFLVGPTAPSIAFQFGKRTDPLEMYLTDIMTVGANLAGIPAISVPIGKVTGMPVGFQIMAPQRHDLQLLSCAQQIIAKDKLQ
jgi:aspartyl-tRNA(Asn)/glutamyl-tRNA(Gln) amidotransferase subunit A